MKKYLLLASTALLFSTNVWADPAPDGQSATLTANAELVPADTIESVQNMNFGKIAIKGIEDGWKVIDKDVLVAIMTPGGVVTSQHADFITSSATAPQQGKVIFTNSAHNISISCTTAEGSVDPSNGGSCRMSNASGLALRNVTMATEGKTINLGGSLYTEDAGIDMSETHLSTTLTVTLKY